LQVSRPLGHGFKPGLADSCFWIDPRPPKDSKKAQKILFSGAVLGCATLLKTARLGIMVDLTPQYLVISDLVFAAHATASGMS
jgi:hypothetical protein